MNIVKNKNFLNFLDDCGVVIGRLDINTGYMYGKTDKPVKSVPTGVTSIINDNYSLHNCERKNVVSILHHLHYCKSLSYSTLHEKNIAVKSLILADRFDSIGGLACSQAHIFLSEANLNDLNWIDKNFALIVKILKQNKNYFYPYPGLSEVKSMVLASQFDLSALPEQLVSPFYQIVTSHPQYIDFSIYYLTKSNLMLMRELLRISYCQIIQIIREYYDCCQELNIKPQKEKDFLRHAVEIKKSYNLMKEEIDNKKFLNIYNNFKSKLLYSDENYSVILPQKTNDLVQEGIKQNNCVGSYANRILSSGNGLVVFIRRNNQLDNSYVTCEINKRNGEILQFLLACNKRPSFDNLDLLNFKHNYQNFLRASFRESDLDF